MTLYDVCNDYTLDVNVSVARRAEAETNKYSWRTARAFNGVEISIGRHREHNEIHYVKGPEGLNGWTLECLNN